MRAREFVTEKWTKKYKKSINCSNPKGFSQKAHCAGRKKNEDVEQGVAEGLIDYAQRKLGLKWGKIGDVVKGSVVAEYLDSQDDSMDTDRYINSKFKLINITANEAEKYREISDLNGWPSDTPLEKVKGWGIDNYKMDRIRKNDVTYQSLMKHTPVVSSRGFIINGNHRVARALEMGIDPIPILKELQQGVAEELDEDLRKWFKQKWVRFGPDGKIRGDCARGSEKEGKPKCLPQSKAHALGKKGRATAAARKRREDPNANRSGKAINVKTK